MSSAAIYASMSYVDINANIRHELGLRLESGFIGLGAGYRKFILTNTVAPTYMNDITPMYAFRPPALWAGAGWDYGQNALLTEDYFCFYAPANKTQLLAAISLESKFSPEAYFISNGCGAKATNYPTLALGDQVMAITLWQLR